MKVFNLVSDLQSSISNIVDDNKTIGFVPTMGALHAGHISLVTQSVQDNDITIVSIFVNPTQFNNSSDLEKYPRTIEQDIELLKTTGADYVFIPTIEEIYPEPDNRLFNFGQLEKVMEGKFRPGHFNGVAQVVSRLFDIVKPTKAYFGEKDFQQLAIIRKLVEQLKASVEIVAVPIKRELSGLAMSSRNQRLTPEEKTIAANIYRILLNSKKHYPLYSVSEIEQYVITQINNIEGLEVEYFEIVDGYTLQPIRDWKQTDYVVGCITVYCREIRLIDNVEYKKDN